MTLKRKILVYSLVALAAILIALFIYKYKMKLNRVLFPFFIAMIVAYLIKPLVARMEKRKIPRMAGVIIVYVVFLIILALSVIFIVPETVNSTKDLINTLPDITERYRDMADGLLTGIRSSNWPPDVKNAIFNEFQNSIDITQDYIISTLKKTLLAIVDILTAVVDLILAMIIAYYFIKDADFFQKMMLSVTPRKFRNGIVTTGREINRILSSFIQGQLLTALIVGILEIIGLMIIRVKYPVVLGMVGGMANIIPYFGPFIGAIPAVAVALTISPIKALWTVVVFVIVQQIDNAFISPKIIEGRLGLHPVTTIMAVLIGGEFFGILGMLIAVPITAIIKVVSKRIIEAIV